MAIDISHRRQGPIRKIQISQGKKEKPGMSADMLKLIAIIAMVIDHIAWAFVSFGSIAGQVMHIVGRITAPIMCFMVAEGYSKTHDPKKYALRLGIFAVISHIPFVFFETNSFNPLSNTSVIFTLFLGLIALMIHDSLKLEQWAKTGIIFGICLISMIGDWNAFAVIYIYYFYVFRYDRKAQIKCFCVINAVLLIIVNTIDALNGIWFNDMFQAGVFLAVPLLMLYNGKRNKGKASKWFFYIFYPAHLMALGIIRYYVFK